MTSSQCAWGLIHGQSGELRDSGLLGLDCGPESSVAEFLATDCAKALRLLSRVCTTGFTLAVEKRLASALVLLHALLLSALMEHLLGPGGKDPAIPAIQESSIYS